MLVHATPVRLHHLYNCNISIIIKVGCGLIFIEADCVLYTSKWLYQETTAFIKTVFSFPPFIFDIFTCVCSFYNVTGIVPMDIHWNMNIINISLYDYTTGLLDVQI